MRFKIDWVSLIVGRKFTVFVFFYLVFEGNFQVQAYIWRAILKEGFSVMGLGAYTWRGLFLEFYSISFSLFSLLLFHVICLMCNKVVVVVVLTSILRENNMSTKDYQNNV